METLRNGLKWRPIIPGLEVTHHPRISQRQENHREARGNIAGMQLEIEWP